MGRGIIGTVQLAAVLVFALPAAFVGLQRLVEGDTFFGVALIGIAVLMVGVEEYFTKPTDLPSEAAERVVDATIVEDDDE